MFLLENAIHYPFALCKILMRSAAGHRQVFFINRMNSHASHTQRKILVFVIVFGKPAKRIKPKPIDSFRIVYRNVKECLRLP